MWPTGRRPAIGVLAACLSVAVAGCGLVGGARVEMGPKNSHRVCIVDDDGTAGVFGVLSLTVIDEDPDATVEIQSVGFRKTENLVLKDTYFVDSSLGLDGLGTARLSTVHELDIWEHRKDAVGATLTTQKDGYDLLLVIDPKKRGQVTSGSGVIVTYRDTSNGRTSTASAPKYTARLLPSRKDCGA